MILEIIMLVNLYGGEDREKQEVVGSIRMLRLLIWVWVTQGAHMKIH